MTLALHGAYQRLLEEPVIFPSPELPMPRQRTDYLHVSPTLLTAETHAAFDRAIARALRGLRGSAAPLRRVIATAMSELIARPVSPAAALAHLNVIVENASRGAPGDRMSLMSGKPRWMAIRDQVLADATATLAPATTPAGFTAATR